MFKMCAGYATPENTPKQVDDTCYAFEWLPSQPAARGKLTVGLYAPKATLRQLKSTQ